MLSNHTINSQTRLREIWCVSPSMGRSLSIIIIISIVIVIKSKSLEPWQLISLRCVSTHLMMVILIVNRRPRLMSIHPIRQWQFIAQFCNNYNFIKQSDHNNGRSLYKRTVIHTILCKYLTAKDLRNIGCIVVFTIVPKVKNFFCQRNSEKNSLRFT